MRLALIPSNGRDGSDSHNLTQALFGILMLLPQTEAFTLLKNRLECALWSGGGSKQNASIPPTTKSIEDQSGISFSELLEHFKSVQDMHQQQRNQQRKKNVEIAFNEAK